MVWNHNISPRKKTLHCAVDIFPVSETQVVLYFLNNCCRVIDTLFKNFKRSPYSRRMCHNIPLGYIYPRVALPPQEDVLWTHLHGGASPLLLHSHCPYRPRRKKMSQKINLQILLQPSQCHMHWTRFLRVVIVGGLLLLLLRLTPHQGGGTKNTPFKPLLGFWRGVVLKKSNKCSGLFLKFLWNSCRDFQKIPFGGYT